MAARLEHGDVGEDEAALKLAKRLAGAHLRCSAPFTGRVNLFAEAAGLAIIDADAIDRLNAVDEAITAATLPPHRAVADGDMVATVKIIPFAVPGSTLEAALEALGSTAAISVAAIQADAHRGRLDDASGPQGLRRRENVARARGAARADGSAHRGAGDRPARGRASRESAREAH